MNENIEQLIGKIKALENELSLQLQKTQKEFFYTIDRKRVYFKREARLRHKMLAKKMGCYFHDASGLNILTIPLIWGCLPIALMMDIVVNIFQAICFPIYGIPKVKRSNYFFIDRYALSYLNLIEKINCAYCSYFIGVIDFVQEVAARTEQYWCPIKHAQRMVRLHNRYDKFFDYGDGETYRQQIEKVRSDFADLLEEEERTRTL